MNWIVVLWLTNLVLAINNILDKKLIDNRVTHPLACAVSFGLVGLPTTMVLLCLLPPTPWPQALSGLVAGMIFFAAVYFYYDIITREDISRVVPLLRLAPAQVMLFSAVFLKETLTERQWIGFWVMVVSSMIITMRPSPGKLMPSIGITVSSGTIQVLPVTVLLSLEAIVMAQVYRNTSLWAGIAWENAGITAATVLTGVFIRLRGGSIWAGTDRRTWGVLISEQVIRLLAGIAPAWAIANGISVGLVSALSGVRFFWVWILAIIILREPQERTEFILKVIGMVGVVLSMLLIQ